MDNYTYYKDEIEKIVRSGDHIAVTVKGNKPICCQGIQCCDCKFDNIGQICMDCRSKWLNSEHVEQPTWTQAENDFLDVGLESCAVCCGVDLRASINGLSRNLEVFERR